MQVRLLPSAMEFPSLSAFRAVVLMPCYILLNLRVSEIDLKIDYT